MLAANFLYGGGEEALVTVAIVAGFVAVIGLICGCAALNHRNRENGWFVMCVALVVGAIFTGAAVYNANRHYYVERAHNAIETAYPDIYDIHVEIDGQEVKFRNTIDEPCEGEYVFNDRTETVTLYEVICDDGRLTEYDPEER